jgi:chromosome segregation ATPase
VRYPQKILREIFNNQIYLGWKDISHAQNDRGAQGSSYHPNYNNNNNINSNNITAELVKLKVHNHDLKLQVNTIEAKLKALVETASRFEIQLFQQRLLMGKHIYSIELLHTKLVDSKSTAISLKSELVEEERRCAHIKKNINDKLQHMTVNPKLNLVKRQVKRIKQYIQSQQHKIDDLKDDKLVATMRLNKLQKMANITTSRGIDTQNHFHFPSDKAFTIGMQF